MSRIVIFAPNWLGDAVMALPAISDVRRAAPGARIAVAARASIAPLFAMVPEVDETIVLVRRASIGDVGSWRGIGAELAGRGFDTALLLPNSIHSALIAKRAGIPERWGHRAPLRAGLLTRAIARRFDLSFVAVALPQPAGWDVFTGGSEELPLDEHDLTRAMADAQRSIEFDAQAAEYIRARRVHGSQRLATIAGGGVRLTMTIGDLTQVVSWILEWGARAKVLEPPELIDRVRAELTGALALYPAAPSKSEDKPKAR